MAATQDPSKFVTDQLFAKAYPVAANVTASVAGKPAQVIFAGLITPGLYLVRVAIPSTLAPGPQPIRITAGASQTSPLLIPMVGTP